jgi:DNA invertase Pin-like site-specific DNA recombinase
MLDLGGDVTGNGISKLVFTILSAVAEAERDRIRERSRDVKKDERNRNRSLGGKSAFRLGRGQEWRAGSGCETAGCIRLRVKAVCKAWLSFRPFFRNYL